MLWVDHCRSFGEHHLRAVWRLSLGLGVVSALAVLIWRINMDEPTRYKKDSIVREETPYWLILRRYWMSFSDIAITWFVYDFITLVTSYLERYRFHGNPLFRYPVSRIPGHGADEFLVVLIVWDLLFNCRGQVCMANLFSYQWFTPFAASLTTLTL